MSISIAYFLWPSVLHGPWRCSEWIQDAFFPASGIDFHLFFLKFYRFLFPGFFFLPLYLTCALHRLKWSDAGFYFSLCSGQPVLLICSFLLVLLACLFIFMGSNLRFRFMCKIFVTHLGNSDLNIKLTEAWTINWKLRGLPFESGF